jgi:hypothetical protein
MKLALSLIVSIFLITASSMGQETAMSSIDTLGVVIHADPKLDILMNAMKPKPGRMAVIRSGRGYRVQIYNGNDRKKATELKMDFMRRFPGMRTYMTYIQPQFRVKIGDFRTRADARKMYEQLATLYSPLMIVPDIIVINTLKDDQ